MTTAVLPFGADGLNVPLVLLLVKATIILLAALGATIAMARVSAGARHLVWLVALGTLLLAPALTAWAPLRVHILPDAALVSDAGPDPSSNRSAQRVTPNIANEMAALGVDPTSAIAPRNTPDANPAATVDRPTGVIARAADAVRGTSTLALLLALWGVVGLAIMASLAWSALAVRRIVHNGRSLDDAGWRTPLYEVADRLGLESPPRLLRSEEAKMPFACGLLQPTIVLPAECDAWTLDRRRAVLLHELAHVRRHDLLGHTLGRLACATYWFHPLVWTAAKRLRAESERACDDLALACGTRATDYAEHLLDIVTSVRRERTPAVALAMARRREFEGRMLAILDPELRHSSPSRRQSAALITTLALVSLTVAAAAPVPRQARTAAAPPAPHSSTEQPTTRLKSRRAVDAVSAAARNTERVVRTDSEPHQLKFTVATGPQPAPNLGPIVGRFVQGVTEQTLDAVIPNVIAALGAQGAQGAQATQKAQSAQGVHGTDDRPILLARILRSDTSATLRRVAAWGLHEYAEQPIASEALATAVTRDAEASVREMAAWSLAESNDDAPAIAALSTAVRRDASSRVRAIAAWALGHLDDRGSVDALVAALADTSLAVRTRAVWALGSIEPHEAPRALIAMLGDPEPHVRHLVAWALFRIEDPAAAPALEAAIKKETDKDLQLADIRALAALGEKSTDALRPLLESSDQRVRSMAVHALAGGRASGPWPWPWPEPRPSP